MSKPQSPLQGLFDFLKNVFKVLFSGKKKKEKRSNTNSTGNSTSSNDGNTTPPSTNTTTTDNQNNTSSPDEQQANDFPAIASMNVDLGEATFKYGNSQMTITKSKKFLAVQTMGSRDIFGPSIPVARQISRRSLKDEGQMLGDFELLESTEQTPGVMEETVEEVRNLPNVGVCTHVYHNTDNKNDLPLVPSGELYVVFNDEISEAEITGHLNHFHLVVKEKRANNKYIVHVSKESPNPIKVTVGLQKSPSVVIAEPDFRTPIHYESFLPSDDLLKEQWHLQNTGQHGKWPASSYKVGADAKVVEAWKWMQSLGSSNITVAVIDNGFDMTHPDLRGDGTKIVHPFNFKNDTNDPSPGIGDWHGTPCAAVAIGAANGTGVVGAAPNAKLMPLKSYYISDSMIEKWFSWAADNGADVISNSWGVNSRDFRLSNRMIESMRKAATQGRNGKGCVILFAAGNSNQSISNDTNPDIIMGFATHPNVMAISASSSRDERSSYSNFGKQISVCAPSNGTGGAGVTTADVGGTIPLPSGGVGFKGDEPGLYTHSFGGTSSACPLVAGVAALMLSVNPSLTSAQVKKILEDTADKIPSSNVYTNGHSIYFGHGRINALKAVQKAKTGQVGTVTPPPVVIVPPAPPTPTPPPPTTPPPAGGGGSDETPNVPVRNVPVVEVPFMANTNGAFSGANQEHIYKITLSNSLTITLDSPVGDNNDFDLYWLEGAIPDPVNRRYQATSVTQGPNEKLELTGIGKGIYYGLVRAYQGNGGYNYKASFTPTADRPGIGTLVLEALQGGFLFKEKMPEIAFKSVVGNKIKVNLRSSAVGANFDVYIKRGGIPKWNDFDARGVTQSTDETLTLNNAQAGDYYVLVRSAKGQGNYGLSIVLA